MPTWNDLMFQDSMSFTMYYLCSFHDHALVFLSIILFAILYWISVVSTSKLTNHYFFDFQSLEIIWTIMPAVVIITLALPSLKVLYMMEESSNPLITLKVIGSQWYWSYEMPELSLSFDSYMIPQNDLSKESFRLLDVDNSVPLPFGVPIRLLITASDVIHSWTIPALGLKADGIPGRLNMMSTLIQRPGIFYGQCSEICGANHSFMPIRLESIPMSKL